jgi:hypothetical protein
MNKQASKTPIISITAELILAAVAREGLELRMDGLWLDRDHGTCCAVGGAALVLQPGFTGTGADTSWFVQEAIGEDNMWALSDGFENESFDEEGIEPENLDSARHYFAVGRELRAIALGKRKAKEDR